jgi:hypothetical protein
MDLAYEPSSKPTWVFTLCDRKGIAHGTSLRRGRSTNRSTTLPPRTGKTAGGAGGARTRDRRIMRSLPSCNAVSSCNDGTDNRTDGTHRTGVIQPAIPRTIPRPTTASATQRHHAPGGLRHPERLTTAARPAAYAQSRSVRRVMARPGSGPAPDYRSRSECDDRPRSSCCAGLDPRLSCLPGGAQRVSCSRGPAWPGARIRSRALAGPSWREHHQLYSRPARCR